MNKRLVSVIVPAYNAEEYIEYAIDSILVQSYTELELIIIDDGSKDMTYRICKEKKKYDKRIRLIKQENMGVSMARNRGLEESLGNYILFVDADDWLEKNCISRLVNAMEDFQAELVMCGYFKNKYKKEQEVHIFQNNVVFSDDGLKELQLMLFGPIGNHLKNPHRQDMIAPVWAKLYKKEVLKSSQFLSLEKTIGEDCLFNISAFFRAKTIAYINVCLYHYRKGIETSVTSKYDDSLERRIDAFYKELVKLANENKADEIYFEAINNRKVFQILSIGLNTINSKNCYEVKIKKIKDYMNREDYKEALKNIHYKDLSAVWKVLMCIYKRNRPEVLYLCMLCMDMLRKRI